MSAPSEQRTPLSASAFHILLSLSGGPLHGYAVMQRVGEAGVKVGPGTIYGALHRMREAGWVEETVAEKSRGPRGQRQRYGLTDEGRGVLRHEARRVVRAADLIHAHAVLGDEDAG